MSLNNNQNEIINDGKDLNINEDQTEDIERRELSDYILLIFPEV